MSDPTPASAPEAVPHEGAPAWTPAQRFAFRAGFVYLGLYIVTIISHYSHPPKWIAPPIRWTVNKILEITAAPKWFMAWFDSGCDASGPTCWLYQVLWDVNLALAVAVVWTAIDRRSRHYRGLHAGQRVALRYLLALIAWNYAVAKFKGTQFWLRAPTLLITPLGEWGRMDLMWTTMGVSVVFGMFTGIGEAVGAFLLMWRRTVTLGALVAASIMGVIAVLDVIHFAGSVGQSAFNSMVAGLALALPDLNRLLQVYVWNRAAPERPAEPRMVRWRIGRWLKIAAVAYVIALPFRRTPSYFRAFWVERHPLSGLYQVEAHDQGWRTLRPVVDTLRWEFVDLTGRNGTFRGTPELPTSFAISRKGGYDALGYQISVDTAARRIRFERRRDKGVDTVGMVAYRQGDDRRLTLDGRIDHDSVHVELRWLPLEGSALFGGMGYQGDPRR